MAVTTPDKISEWEALDVKVSESFTPMTQRRLYVLRGALTCKPAASFFISNSLSLECHMAFKDGTISPLLSFFIMYNSEFVRDLKPFLMGLPNHPHDCTAGISARYRARTINYVRFDNGIAMVVKNGSIKDYFSPSSAMPPSSSV
ncbi:hypothetical protein HYY73_05945 [Candidatus Woesearchaeota archaeon]|nr:hypothetical protein [Candidatus Woesearchaeota archaeon]